MVIWLFIYKKTLTQIWQVSSLVILMITTRFGFKNAFQNGMNHFCTMYSSWFLRKKIDGTYHVWKLPRKLSSSLIEWRKNYETADCLQFNIDQNKSKAQGIFEKWE